MANEAFRHGDDVRERAFAFACQVVEFCDELFACRAVGRIMAPQLLRCSTSIPGMLEEARAAESRRDFLSKCSIALKEARETHIRLRIHERCKVGNQPEASRLRAEANELVAILTAITRNTRANDES